MVQRSFSRSRSSSANRFSTASSSFSSHSHRVTARQPFASRASPVLQCPAPDSWRSWLPNRSGWPWACARRGGSRGRARNSRGRTGPACGPAWRCPACPSRSRRWCRRSSRRRACATAGAPSARARCPCALTQHMTAERFSGKKTSVIPLDPVTASSNSAGRPGSDRRSQRIMATVISLPTAVFVRVAGQAKAARPVAAQAGEACRQGCRPPAPQDGPSRSTRRWTLVTISSITPQAEDARHEARADPLDLVRSGRAARQHSRAFGLDRHHLHRGLTRLQHLADAGDGPAGADAGDHRIDLAAGVGPDLLGRGHPVDGRDWQGVLELLRHHRTGDLGQNLLGRTTRTAPCPFFSAGVSSSRAPSRISILRRSSDMLGA